MARPVEPTELCSPNRTDVAKQPSDLPVENSAALEKFYLTTAINYTNGAPHVGHAYEIIVSDMLSRYHKTYGRDVMFLTGTDEHGQKIAATAASKGMEPLELCTDYAKQFQELNKMLNVADWCRFGRTTDANHIQCAQWVWKRASHDIYLDKYVGWYNVREETFVTEHEAQMSDYKDPTSGVPLQKMEEVSYFFRMSKYQEQLIAHIEQHPEFIQPDFRRNEILARLRKEPLLDLSVSRTTFDWGIPVPGDEKHVMYVWFDALTNYLTGINYHKTTSDAEISSAKRVDDANTEKGDSSGANAHYWPCNCHMIGKDILWFHSVIWPCILMSAKIPLPQTIFAHGFVVAGDGRKMSKSLGNVIDPVAALTGGVVDPETAKALTVPSDTFRYFIVKAAELGRDMRFDIAALKAAHNADLCDGLGNLLHRATGLCAKFCNGCVPQEPVPEGPNPFDARRLIDAVDAQMRGFEIQAALDLIMVAVRNTNKYLTDHAPWAVTCAVQKRRICRAIVEALYILAHLLECIIPTSAATILTRLGTAPRTIAELSESFDNLTPGAKVTVGNILFDKYRTS